MARLDDNLRSTFPIPTAKLRMRKLQAALASPISWAPFLPVVGAYTFFDLGTLPFLGLLLAVGVGIGSYWKKEAVKLESSLLERLITESNEAQDSKIGEIIRDLMKNGSPDYAMTLGSFLETKQSIEKALHNDESSLTPQKEEIDSLVDKVTFGVADQLQRLAEFDQRLEKPTFPLTDTQQERIEISRRQIARQVQHAWETIDETWQNLGELLDPTAGLAAETGRHDHLDLAIARLREEKDIAERVRERMKSEWPDSFDSTSEPLSETE